MQEFVDSMRPSRTGHNTPDPNIKDQKYGNVKVSSSTLASCGSSFLAADEKRKKASTEHFSDTGMFAMLCRHDTPLFAVNMTTAGEKQYYALALINRLFKEIPGHVHPDGENCL